MIANYHTHTPRCHHAVGNEEEYIRCALERGLQELGFSDHAPQLFPGDYYSTFRMRPEELTGYMETVRTLRDKYRDRLTIHVGMEMEYYPDIFPKTMPLLREQGVEYLLLGQHCLGNEEPGNPYSSTPTGDESVLKWYCDQVIAGMHTGFFTYLAHPDLIHFTGDDRVYARYMENLCREAKACGMPLEVNLLGMEEKRHYPRRLFWEIAAQVGNPVVLGCDAHRPEALSDTAPEQEALKLVRDLQLPLLETVELRPIG